MKQLVLAFLLLLPAAALAQDVAIAERREADGTMTLVHEVVVPAAQAEVWTAISTPEGWRTWAVPAAWLVDGDTLETSYTPTASPGDPSTIRQHLTAILPGRTLVFRTTKAPDGFPHFETFRRVTHFFELEPAGEGRTRARLTGVGYAGTDAGRQLAAFFRDGNRVSLERLRARFVGGPLDWPAILAAERTAR
ncbi:MAG TPA: SRPBCC domain-containing protein [Allosphingosinicella sp.]|nr:SRPBCC domain-containing protein [Allosphingosinicella sp.]